MVKPKEESKKNSTLRYQAKTKGYAKLIIPKKNLITLRLTAQPMLNNSSTTRISYWLTVLCNRGR
jgi:hypothetical protein